VASVQPAKDGIVLRLAHAHRRFECRLIALHKRADCDEVEVCVESLEDGFGETRLSREKAKRAQTWVELEKFLESGEIITGHVAGKVKGGLTVDIKNVRAFLPGSLVDVRPVRDLSYLEDKDIEVKVIKLDKRRNNVVVSRRAVIVLM
jgi:small subunit ribosomal protein S1